MVFVIDIVHFVALVLNICVIADILVSYFLSPFHPVRSFLDKIVQPLLNPIRRIVPTIQMIDFSPLVLIILIQLIETLLTSFLTNLG